MKNRALIIAIIGLFVAILAIVLNLASDTVGASQSLTLEAAMAGLIALTCGMLTFRKGGGWRFLGIAMLGPSVFVVADCAIRLLLWLKSHG